MSSTPVYNNPDLAYTLYAAIIHPHEARVLLLPSEGGVWSLPAFTPSEHFLAHVEGTNGALKEMLGTEVNTLRIASILIDREATKTVQALSIMELQDDAWQPPAMSIWADAEQLDNLRLANEWPREGLAQWLHEDAACTAPEKRAPWGRRGWHREASAWIKARLAEHSIEMLGPPHQLKVWSISCVLRCPTGSGDVYFKAVPSMFSNESGITQALSAWFPDYVPSPIAVDFSRSWMLLHDFRGAEMREADPDEKQWYDLLAILAEIQVACVGRDAKLLAAGCQDRGIPDLERKLDALLANSMAMNSLESALRSDMLQAAPRLKAMCQELANYNVPQTLLHGDLHLGNVISSKAGYCIFDWTDGAASHPFFDLITLFRYDFNKKTLGDPAPFYDYYLEFWTRYEPIERLQEVLALTRVLGPLYHAISYLNIVENLEPSARWEMGSAMAGWLKEMLSALTGEQKLQDRAEEDAPGEV